MDTKATYTLATFIAIAAFAAGGVFAQGNPEMMFPIPELDNCGSEDECRTYCDNQENAESCAAWAKARGVAVEETPPIPEEGGPGGCKNPGECRAYCDNPEHKNECIDFAVSKGFMTSEEGERAKNAPPLSEQQNGRPKDGPGGCNSKESCDAFCRAPENKETCISFAVEHGFMTLEEAARVRAFTNERQFEPPRPRQPRPLERPGKPKIDEEKAKAVLEAGGGPGGCKTSDECRAYCDESANRRSCMQFAREHALIAPDEADKFEKLLDVEGPGGCKGEECEAYCEAEGHEEECLAFARKHDLIGEEEFAQAKKFLEASRAGGPGECRGRACEAYCADSAHGEECFAFAKKHDLIPPEELERAESMRSFMQAGGPGGCRGEEECHAYCNDPVHFEECQSFASRAGIIDDSRAREMMEQFKAFNEKFGDEDERGFPPPGAFPGRPGEFSERGGFPSPEFPVQGNINGERGLGTFMKPLGTCDSPEACMKFCTEHPEADFCRGAKDAMGRTRGDMKEMEFRPKEFPDNMIRDDMQYPPHRAKPPEGYNIPPQRYSVPPGVPPEGYGGTMLPPGYGGGFERPPEGFAPPQGFTPPGGMMMPPPDGALPPAGDMPPPPPEQPISAIPLGSFIAGVLQVFSGVF